MMSLTRCGNEETLTHTYAFSFKTTHLSFFFVVANFSILCENGYGLDPLKNAKLMLAKKNNISFRRVSPDLWQWVSMMKEEYLLKVNSSQ
jgi:hypothetical protein